MKDDSIGEGFEEVIFEEGKMANPKYEIYDYSIEKWIKAVDAYNRIGFYPYGKYRKPKET